MRFTPKSITESATFAKLVERSFQEVDFEGNGSLGHLELHIALLLLYDKLNSSLPVHIPVPTRDEVADFIERFDADNSGQLEFPEFLELTKALFGGKNGWKDSILLRAAILMLTNLLIWPLAGSGARRGVLALGLSSAAVVPSPVWAIGAENAVKFVYGTMMK